MSMESEVPGMPGSGTSPVSGSSRRGKPYQRDFVQDEPGKIQKTQLARKLRVGN